MVWVAFLRDYESHATGAVIDVGRFHHAEALVEGNIARWATEAEIQTVSGVLSDTGDDVAIYDEGSSVVAAASIIDFVGDNVAVTAATATRATVTVSSGAGHTGTTGSVFFAGAGGAESAPTEDNANLFYNDTDNRLGVGTNVPLTDLHVQNATAGGTLTLATGDTTVLGSNNELGRINFQAPLEASGGDAVLVGASIHAVANAGFSSTVNETDLVFSVANSEAAIEHMRLTGENGYLGHGTSTPTSPVHLKHSPDGLFTSIFKVQRTSTNDSAYSVYIGSGASDGDLIVTGAGKVGINIDGGTLNAQLRVETATGGPLMASAMYIKQNRTGASTLDCATFWQEGDRAPCVKVIADSLTTATALTVQAHALTTGSVASFTSASADTSLRQIISASNTNTAATSSSVLKLWQAATADGSKFINMVSEAANTPVFNFYRTGHVDWLPLASNTDAAPTADATLKKVSLQYNTGGPPSNANYLQYTAPGGGTTDFYQVLEEG